MTVISEPGFENISGWILTSRGGFSTPTQDTHWASEGAHSMKYIKPNSRQEGGAYARASISVDFDSNFKLRFDYHIHRCVNEDNGNTDPALVIRILVDNTVIESLQPIAYGTVLDHDTPLLSGYTGVHTLHVEYRLLDWYDTKYAICLWIDNLRVVSEIPTSSRFEVTVNNIAANGVAILAATPWSGVLGDICVFGQCSLNNLASKDIPVPVPASKVLTFTEADGLKVGKRYVFYAANYVLGLPVPKIYEAEGKLITMQAGVNKVTINGYAETLPWESWICGLFGVADIDCAQAVRTFGADFIYGAETWSRITKNQNLDGSYAAPGTLDYIFAGLDMLPLVNVPAKYALKLGDKVVSMFGAKIAKIAEHVPKADIANWMNTVGVDNLAYTLARVNNEHIDELLGYLDAGNFNAATTWVSKYFPAPDLKATKATVESFRKQIEQIYDVFRGEGDNVAKNVKAGEAFSTTAVEVAADYADEIVKLRGYYKDSVAISDIIRLDDIVTKNPTEWLKVLNPATGISMADLYRVEGLVTSGNAKKLKDAGKLDGFLTKFTDAVSGQPSKYREIMKAYSDAEVKAISDELISAGKAAEAGIYTSLREVQKASVAGEGVIAGVGKVARPLEAAGKQGGTVAVAGGKVIDDAIKTIPPVADDIAKITNVETAANKVGGKGKGFFDILWNKLKKDVEEIEGKPWDNLTQGAKLRGYLLWTHKQSTYCFMLFIAEEALQTACQFSLFPISSDANNWRFLTGTQRTQVLKDYHTDYDRANFMWYLINAAQVPFMVLCPLFSPLYVTFTVGSRALLDGHAERIARLEADKVDNGWIGYLAIRANIDGVEISINEALKEQTAGTYRRNYKVLIRDDIDATDFKVMGRKKGYITAIKSVTLTSDNVETPVDVDLEMKTDPDIPGMEIVSDPAELKKGVTIPETGSIYCESTPNNANIWIKSKATGVTADVKKTTAWTVPSIAVGDYIVIFKKENYKDCSKDVTVVADKTANAQCDLESICSFPTVSISYTPTSPKVGDEVKFTGSVAGAEASKMKNWKWDFGDGTTGTGMTPTHTYTVDGTKAVTLTVTNECDKLYDGYKNITVSKVCSTPVPSASTNTTSPKIGEEVTFTGGVGAADASKMKKWEWDFGDGTTGTGKETKHTYTTKGAKTIKLTVTNECDALFTTTTYLTVYCSSPTPSASTSSSNPKIGEEVTFTGGVGAADASKMKKWEWDFGDGTTGTGKEAKHTYSVKGLKAVKLTVTNECDELFTTTTYLTVYCSSPTPSASTSSSNPKIGEEVTFTGGVGAADASKMKNWEWDFGDGTTGKGKEAKHTYSVKGLKAVKLTVTNECDELFTTTVYLTVYCSTPSVNISLSPSYPKTNEEVSFTGSVSEADPTKMKKWDWDFGDISTGTVQNPKHTYTTEGTYTVRLTVTNECDETFNASKTVTISKALGIINCLCTGDYCARGMDIYINGVIQGLKTTDKPFFRSFDVAPGTHTVKYSLVGVLEGSQSVTVAAGETKVVDIAPVGVLDPSQVGVTTTVTAIEDGDTIRTALTEALAAKPSIRMTGFDALESGTVEGINATDYLKSLIPIGSTITLKIWKQLPLDIYNRVLGGVFVGTKDISLEMIKSCLVKKYTAHDKFYWIDWALYDSLWCDNTLYGSMTVKAYDADNNLITGVKVFVDDVDKGDAPITVNSLLAGAHTLRLEKSGYTACKYCLGVGCTPVTQMKPCQFSTNIVKGQVVTYEATMLKTFPVTILSSPSGAAIEIDGSPAGVGRVMVQQTQTQVGTKVQKVKGNLIEKMLEELKRANASKKR
jgi:PKD repeat protein